MRYLTHCASATFAFLVVSAGGACGDPSELEALESVPDGVPDSVEPFVASMNDDQLLIEAPAGQFNGFYIQVNWNDWNQEMDGSEEDGGVTSSSSSAVYDVFRRSEDHFLPGAVRIGEPVADFDNTACLYPIEPEVEDCTVTTDVAGVTFDDLDFPRLDESDRFPIDSFTVTYSLTHPGAAAYWQQPESEQTRPFPRIDSVRASFRVEPDGAVTILHDWHRCNDALNRSEC